MNISHKIKKGLTRHVKFHTITNFIGHVRYAFYLTVVRCIDLEIPQIPFIGKITL